VLTAAKAISGRLKMTITAAKNSAASERGEYFKNRAGIDYSLPLQILRCSIKNK
jgi:hypothetical protein